MTFTFGDWSIIGYQYGWQVIRTTTIKSGKGAGDASVDRRTYHITLESAFKALPDIVLREHDGYGPVAAVKAVQALGAELAREIDRRKVRGKAA